MTHTVAVGEFEGPLGILLELVERRQLEVTSISVAEITADYLQRIRGLQTHTPEELSEFLTLGARLLYIKSLALLPSNDPSEQTEELQALSLELSEYKRLQTAAQTLGARTAARTWPRPSSAQAAVRDNLPLPELSLNALAAAFTRALDAAPAAPAPQIIRLTVSQQMVLARLRWRLEAGFELTSLLRECANRLEIVVTFLALLELIRDGAARVGQADQFGAIEVTAA